MNLKISIMYLIVNCCSSIELHLMLALVANGHRQCASSMTIIPVMLPGQVSWTWGYISEFSQQTQTQGAVHTLCCAMLPIEYDQRWRSIFTVGLRLSHSKDSENCCLQAM